MWCCVVSFIDLNQDRKRGWMNFWANQSRGNPPVGMFSFWTWAPPRAERWVGWTGCRPCTCVEPPPFLWAAAARGAVWTACSTMGTLLWGMPWSPDGVQERHGEEGAATDKIEVTWQKLYLFYHSPVLHCTAGWEGRTQPAGCRCASCLCTGSSVGGIQQRSCPGTTWRIIREC